MVRRLLVLATSAAALAAAPAHAAMVAPCNGIPALSDPAGDHGSDGRALRGNLDVTEAFFRTNGPTTTAYVRVARMDKAPQDDPTIHWVTWEMTWTDGGEQRYARAVAFRDGQVSFRYGTGTGTADETSGETSGEIFEGDNGYAAINLPAAFAPAGKVLAKPFARTTYAYGAHVDVGEGYSAVFTGDADRAPDENVGRDYTVGPCVTPAQTPGATGGTAAPAPRPAQPASSSAAASLQITGVARHTKGRRLTLRLRSSAMLRGVVVTLRKGSRSVASGRLARIDGNGTVVLRAKGTLTRGRYMIVAKAGRVSTRRTLTLR